MTQSRIAPLAALNDRFRRTLVCGHVVLTPKVRALPRDHQRLILEAVRAYDDFSAHNDPYGDHDFGVIELDGLPKVFWKIDHLDSTLTAGSPDPHDAAVTVTILTIYLASEH